MDALEFERKFTLWYRQADIRARKKINLEIQRILSRKESEKRLYDAFFLAIKKGNKITAETILNSDDRIDVNKQDLGLGNTPLIYSIINKDIELIKLLLDRGADPRIKNNKGKDSFDAANLIKSSSEILKLISEYKEHS